MPHTFVRLFLTITLVASWATVATAEEFVSIGPYGGDVRSLAVHPERPDRIFVGNSDGQMYVSRDRGLNWEKLVPGIGRRSAVIDNIVFRPDNPDVLYAAVWELKTNEGALYRSEDGGTQWTELSTGQFRSQIRAIAIAPSDPRSIAIGITEGVLISGDEGETWERITRGYRSMYNVESLAFDPVSADTLYVGTWRLGWKTTNRGKKWEPIHEGMYYDSDMFSLLVNPDSPDILFSSACTGVYRSTNAGETWVKLKNGLPSEAKRTRTLLMDPINPQVVYAGTTIGLYITRNGGDSWSRLIKDVVVNSIAVDPSDTDLVLVGTDDAGILRSPDGGETFSQSNAGFVYRQISWMDNHPEDSSVIWANVTHDGPHGGFFLSSDDGNTWDRASEGFDGVGGVRGVIVSRNSGDVMLLTSNGVLRSKPGEGPWEKLEKLSALDIQAAAFADDTESQLIVVTPERFLRVDLATGKTKKLKIEVYDGVVRDVAFSASQAAVFAATDMGVFRSTDGGQSWDIKVRGLPPHSVRSLVVSGDNLFALTDGGLFKSSDGAEQWSASPGLEGVRIAFLKLNPVRQGHVVVGDRDGLYLYQSFDGGENWSRRPTTEFSPISAAAFTSRGELLLGSLSEGVYRVTSSIRAADDR